MIPTHEIPIAHWRKIMRSTTPTWRAKTWKAWKRSERLRQERIKWLYWFVVGTVGVLVGWMVLLG